jgi:hypothetical protein
MRSSIASCGLLRGVVRTAFMVNILAFLTIAVPVTQTQSDAHFRTLDRGTQSGISNVRRVTIRGASEWEAIWAQHAATRERPVVDWEREMVVGLFMGQRPTGGFSTEIVGVEAQPETLIVRYRETQPAPGGMTAQVLTSPYHLVVVPAWAGEVAFEAVP